MILLNEVAKLRERYILQKGTNVPEHMDKLREGFTRVLQSRIDNREQRLLNFVSFGTLALALYYETCWEGNVSMEAIVSKLLHNASKTPTATEAFIEGEILSMIMSEPFSHKLHWAVAKAIRYLNDHRTVERIR